MPREEMARDEKPGAITLPVNGAAEVCVLCGSPHAELVLTSHDRLFAIAPGTFSLVKCTGCGLVRLSPRPTPEQVAGFYASDYWFAGGPMAEFYRRLVLLDHVRFAARAARETGAPGRILDVGCGGGLFLRMMKQRGFDCLGLDFSAEAARVAWQTNGVRVITGDLINSPVEAAIGQESCALITMYHVAEHLLDPAVYLRAARRLLHPDGRLIVQVPDRDCWEAAMLGENWSGLDVPRHIHVFRSSDLQRLLRSCGFETVREKHFSLRDHPAGLATGLAPSLDPVVRAIRGIDHSNAVRIAKDLLYLGSSPRCRHSPWSRPLRKRLSVMIEARRSHDPGSVGILFSPPFAGPCAVLRRPDRTRTAAIRRVTTGPCAGAGCRRRRGPSRRNVCETTLRRRRSRGGRHGLELFSPRRGLRPLRPAVSRWDVRCRHQHRDPRAHPRPRQRALRNWARTEAGRPASCSPSPRTGKFTRRRTIISATPAMASNTCSGRLDSRSSAWTPREDISGCYRGACSTEYNSLRGGGAGFCSFRLPPAWDLRLYCCLSSSRSTRKRISL